MFGGSGNKVVGVLICLTVGLGACASAPKVSLPPPGASRADRARAYERYQIRSVTRHSVTSNWVPYYDYSARIGTEESFSNARHVAQALPDDRKLARHARRYRALRICSWVSIPLSFGATLGGAYSLFRDSPDLDRDTIRANRTIGIVGLSAGLVLSIVHVVFHNLSSRNSRLAYEYYNQALEERLDMKREFVGPRYISDPP